MKTSQAAMRWGVRSSLIDYVARSGGTVSIGPPADWDDGAFSFPLTADERDPSTGRGCVKFAGDVVFEAHGGMMRMLIAEPWIEFVDAGTFLTVHADRRVPLALLTARSRGFDAAVTASGSAIFGGVYEEGAGLDPIELVDFAGRP